MLSWLMRGQAGRGLVSAPPGRSVFDSISMAELVTDPYPHLVLENALPAEIADTLLAAMPPIEVFTRNRRVRSNYRFPLPSHIALADSRVSEEWKEAQRQCNAALPSLLSHFIHRFRRDILQAFPDFSSRFAALEDLRVVPRAKRWRRRDEIGMDAQMVINSPALIGGTSVRGPHIDAPNKLISALLYLRAPHDDSTGGDLQLCAPNTDCVRFDRWNAALPGHVRVARTYPYRHNLLILPLSMPTAVHGVSPRGATAHPRYHLHLVGEMSAPLFEMPH